MFYAFWSQIYLPFLSGKAYLDPELSQLISIRYLCPFKVSLIQLTLQTELHEYV